MLSAWCPTFPVHRAHNRLWIGNSISMNVQQTDETRLAKRIEAGLFAQEMLDSGAPAALATDEELRTLVEEGMKARDDLVLAHLGLVKVIAGEMSRRRRSSFADLFQEGCVALQQAVMSYDWHKGPFGPYAGMWIRAAVRRIGPQGWVPIDDVEVEDSAPAIECESSIDNEGLAQVLQLIPKSQRDVLRWRSGLDGEPRTRKDIADQLGLSIAKVRYLERTGLESVRTLWDEAEAA